MLPIKTLYPQFSTASHAHATLEVQFRLFAALVAITLPFQENARCLSDISVRLPCDAQSFDVSFVGRTLRFAFSSQLDQGLSALHGVVKCLTVAPRSESHRTVGTFTFTHDGTITRVDGAPHALEAITHREGALYIVLHFLFKAINDGEDGRVAPAEPLA